MGDAINYKEAILNAWRLFVNEPAFSSIPLPAIIGQDRIHTRDELFNFLRRDSAKPVFLIGAWGSGKTTYVRSLESELRKRFRYHYRSFYPVSNLNEAYLNLLPRGLWIALSIVGPVAIAAIAWLILKVPTINSHPKIIAIAASLAALFLITNRRKVFYIAASLINSVLCRKPCLTVIDDLERSPMDTLAIWAMLSNLWTVRHRYVILLGYESEEQRADIVSRAIKLDGQLVYLPTDNSVNHKLGKTLDPHLPFSNLDWLSLLTPRDIIRIHGVIEQEAPHYDSVRYRELLYLNQYFLTLMARLGVFRQEFSKITFNVETTSSGTHLKIRRRSQVDTGPVYSATPYLEQFRQSLSAGIQGIFLKQAPDTVEEALTTENIFQIRRLFSLFIGMADQ